MRKAETRHADAELVDTSRGSETGILVRIQGEPNDRSAVQLIVAVRNGPGVGPAIDTELMVGLRGPDLRSLLAVLERAIETAETVRILVKENSDAGILVRSGASTLVSNPRPQPADPRVAELSADLSRAKREIDVYEVRLRRANGQIADLIRERDGVEPDPRFLL